MGRSKPLNGTVGVTKKKLQSVQSALADNDTASVQSFLTEAINACDEDYTVINEE